MSVADAAALAAGDTMTVDAALVTLDFLLRHDGLPGDSTVPSVGAALRAAFGRLLVER
jgi:hypothetical protein